MKRANKTKPSKKQAATRKTRPAKKAKKAVSKAATKKASKPKLDVEDLVLKPRTAGAAKKAAAKKPAPPEKPDLGVDDLDLENH
jgi:hypothetical protein